MNDRAGSADARLQWMLCLASPALWAAHFFVLYASHALICARGGPGQGSWLLLAVLAGISGLGALAAVAGAAHGRCAAGFPRDVALTLAALSFLGVLWTTIAVAVIPACAA